MDRHTYRTTIRFAIESRRAGWGAVRLNRIIALLGMAAVLAGGLRPSPAYAFIDVRGDACCVSYVNNMLAKFQRLATADASGLISKLLDTLNSSFHTHVIYCDYSNNHGITDPDAAPSIEAGLDGVNITDPEDPGSTSTVINPLAFGGRFANADGSLKYETGRNADGSCDFGEQVVIHELSHAYDNDQGRFPALDATNQGTNGVALTEALATSAENTLLDAAGGSCAVTTYGDTTLPEAFYAGLPACPRPASCPIPSLPGVCQCADESECAGVHCPICHPDTHRCFNGCTTNLDGSSSGIHCCISLHDTNADGTPAGGCCLPIGGQLDPSCGGVGPGDECVMDY